MVSLYFKEAIAYVANIKKVIKNDYMVAIICKVLSVLIGVLYSSISARYLGSVVKGEVAYITSIVSIISIIMTLGVHQAYPYYRKQSQDDSLVSPFMNNVIAMMLVYVIGSIAIGCFCSHNATVCYILLLSPIFAYSRIVGYVYLVEHASKRNVIATIISILRTAFVFILFIFTESNLFFGISILMFAEVIMAIIYTVKLRFKLDISQVKVSFLKKIILYGIIPMISLLASTLNYRVDVLMLGNFASISLGEIGIYSIGVGLAEEVILIPETVKEILLSKLSKGSKEAEVARVMRICTPICMGMFVAIIIFGRFVIAVLYGSEFYSAYSVTVITMFGVIAIMYYKMIATYNIVNKKQLFNLIVLLSSICVNVIVNLFLIPKYGIIGASIATVVSYTYCAIVFLTYFSRVSEIKMRDLIFINRSDLELIRMMLGKNK